MRSLFGTVASGRFEAGGLIAVAQTLNWGSTADSSTYASPTFTPNASGHLVLLAVAHNQTASSIADATSFVGTCITGVTKLRTVGFSTIAAATKKTELWVATTTASAGAITLTCPGSPTGAACSAVELTGADTAVGTLGVVQHVGANADSGTGPTATLAAFAHTANAAFAVYGAATNGTSTPKAGWTELQDTTLATPNMNYAVQFINANDTTPTDTLSAGGAWGVVACEIAAA